jgi:small-conductance mechanosensitive channel/CRP-like cAMP-binding protein
MDAALGGGRSGLTSEVIGFPLAAVLLGLTLLLLPRGQRIRARQAGWLLGLSALFELSHPLFAPTASAQRVTVFVSTFCLLASMGRSVVLLVLDIAIERRAARSTPRIFRDLSTGVTYLFVGLIALRAIDVEPGSILTTSALLTAVVGLAMQDTLGNLVSGLALQMQRPFDVGDWIEVDDGQQAGRVTEVTWRATTVMTLDHVEVILPNATLAKAAIRNYSRPSTVSRRRVVVGVAYAAPPDEVREALTAAAHEVPGVLVAPPPRARTHAFGASAIEYELLFFIDDFGNALNVDGAVRDRVYYALARRGIEIPFPTRAFIQHPPVDRAAEETSRRDRCARALARVRFMDPLPDDARAVLVDRAKLRVYGAGEAVVRKGDPSLEFFVIEDGRMSVEAPRPDGPAVEVSELGPGQCFGEMGLLTGERRSATVRAKRVCHLVVLDQEAFHQVLAAHPEVVERMGVLLASRQAELDAFHARSQPPQATEERSRRVISQIREFFRLV